MVRSVGLGTGVDSARGKVLVLESLGFWMFFVLVNEDSSLSLISQKDFAVAVGVISVLGRHIPLDRKREAALAVSHRQSADPPGT